MTHSPEYREQRRAIKKAKRGEKKWAAEVRARAHQTRIDRQKAARKER